MSDQFRVKICICIPDVEQHTSYCPFEEESYYNYWTRSLFYFHLYFFLFCICLGFCSEVLNTALKVVHCVFFQSVTVASGTWLRTEVESI